MNNEYIKRIKLIKFIWMVISIFVLFSAVISILGLGVISSANKNPPLSLGHFELLFQNYKVFLLVQLIIGATILIASLNLDKFNEWSRKLIQSINLTFILFSSISLCLGVIKIISDHSLFEITKNVYTIIINIALLLFCSCCFSHMKKKEVKNLYQRKY